MNKETRWLAVTVVAVLLLGVSLKLAWDWVSPVRIERDAVSAASPAAAATPSAGATAMTEASAAAAVVGQPADPASGNPLATAEPPPGAAPSEVPGTDSRFRASLHSDAVHHSEAVLLFSNASAYQSFLGHAGFSATGTIPEILAVRVRASAFEEIDAMVKAALVQPEVELADADLNWKMSIASSLSPVGPPLALPDDVREYIGITHRMRSPPRILEDGWKIDNSGWGAGLTIALLDTGVAENIAPLRGRVFPVDIGWGMIPDDRHGTALAVMAAGAFDWARGYMGIVPSARILGVRVTAPDGYSDVFSVAQGIVAAAKAGANAIAISPTCPYPALVLTRAVAFATANPNVAVVAARSEDLKPSWPAVTPGVFPVLAVNDLNAPISADGGTARIVRAPTPIVPVVAGPDLTALWVRLDTGPASATTVAAAMIAVFSRMPGHTAAQVGNALRQTAVDASFVLRPEGEGFSLLFINWVPGDTGDAAVGVTPAGEPAPSVARSLPLPDGAPASPTAAAGFIPGTTAIDPATGRPRVTVIRTGPPTAPAQGSTGARAGARGGTTTTTRGN